MPRLPFPSIRNQLLGGAVLLALASSCGGRSSLEDYGGVGGRFEWVDSLPPDAGVAGTGAAGGAGSSGAPSQGGGGGEPSVPGQGGAAGSSSGAAGGGQGGSEHGDAGLGDGGTGADAGARVNLISNPSFEEGHADWQTFGPAGSALGVHEENPRSGDRCLVTRDRTASSSGPLLDITSLLQPAAARYELSAWVRIVSGSAGAAISVRVRCHDAITAYVPVAASAASDEWLELRGQFATPACSLASLSLFIDGPPPGVDLYVDDVGLFALED